MRSLYLIVFFILVFSCKSLTGGISEGSLISHNLESEALQRNRNGQDSSPSIHIYLPHGYDAQREEGYGVIYYLGGYGSPSDSLFVEVGGKGVLDRAIAEGTIPGVIVVGIIGRSQYGGHFFTDSDTTGHWESYVIDEVIPYMDREYNTLAAKESRGLCGFSMGGYGALSIGLRHPQLFQSVFAFSPGLFDRNGFSEEVWETWDHLPGIFTAYGGAFTPSDIANEDGVFAEYPREGEDSPYVDSWNARWSVGYGNIEQKIGDYLALPSSDRLSTIRIDLGSGDHYFWLVHGSREFRDTLNAQGLSWEYNEYADKIHSFTSQDVANLVDYFAGELILE